MAAGLAVACVALTAAPAVADQIRNQEWWLSALHVTTAWESSKGSGVTVAVLDTGVDATQPDLAGSVTTGPDYTGSGRTAGGPFWGINGTAVASLIAGHGHGAQDGDGIIGVAPEAKILSIRVILEGNDPGLPKAGVAAGLTGDIAEGIRYAVGHGAQVIDLPLDPAPLAGSTAPGGSTAERAAVAYALGKNVVLVAPGGDGGAGHDAVNYPAAYPGVISVGAFNQSFTKATFTSRQPYVTLTAAGDGVIAATPSGYVMLHSTSAASAVVAGIAALIRAQFPTLTPAQVTSALTQSTVFRPPGGLKDGSGHGTADAQAALLEAAKINAAVPNGSGSGGAVVAPSSPPVHARGTGIYGTVRYAALGLAVLLVLAFLGFIIGRRARRRRARAARLAPLRDVARVAVRSRPDLSAVPPVTGAQFAESQSGRVQFPRPPLPGTRLPGGQHSAGQHSGGQHSAGQHSGGQHSAGQFAGAQSPGAQSLGAQSPGAQSPGAPSPGARFSGSQFADVPFVGEDYTDSPFPGDPGTETPFLDDPFGEAPYPREAPFPGDDPFGDDDPFGEAPYPGDPLADTTYPGGTEPGTTGPFPAVPPPGNGASNAPGRALAPTPRSHVVRPPRISGNPPWEPAEKPDGELPWSITAPKSVGRPASARRVVPTGAQPWGPAAQADESPDSLEAEAGNRRQSGRGAPESVELGGRAPGSMPLPAPQSGRGEVSDYGDAEEEGRLYVWNPSDTTVAFPKVPPGKVPPGESGRM
jgi:Subtilase family